MYTATWLQETLVSLKEKGLSKYYIVQKLAEMCLGWQYVYASQGQACTPSWRKSRIPYCPEQKYVDMINDNCPVLSGKQPTIYCYKKGSNEKMISPESCDGCAFVDTLVFDCAGFVLRTLTQAGVPFYGQGASTQWNTASNWAAKGTIDTMPRDLVCVVYKRRDDKMSHTGLSMGDGNGGVIHCSTTVKRGNAYTDNSPWTHWGIPKGLYSADELRKAGFSVTDDANVPTLRHGSQGDDVADLQMLLNSKYGYDLEVDGDYGSKTEAAVKAFQKAHGLAADGVVGPKTRKALGLVADTENIAGAIAGAIACAISDPAGETVSQLAPSVIPTEAERERSEMEGPWISAVSQAGMITLPLSEWQSMRAAVLAAYHIISKYESATEGNTYG